MRGSFAAKHGAVCDLALQQRTALTISIKIITQHCICLTAQQHCIALTTSSSSSCDAAIHSVDLIFIQEVDLGSCTLRCPAHARLRRLLHLCIRPAMQMTAAYDEMEQSYEHQSCSGLCNIEPWPSCRMQSGKLATTQFCFCPSYYLLWKQPDQLFNFVAMQQD